MTPAEFRAVYPEFTIDKYPDAFVQVWIDISTAQVNQQKWMNLTSFGIAMLTAHYLYINKYKGTIPKILTSKSVDALSAGYDINSVTYQGAGFYNQSNYGIQFYRLSRHIGAGPSQF